MDNIKSGWVELRAESQPRCPKLFYRFAANDKHLELFFTDLIGLWASRSSVHEVYEYAKRTRASIDPSADTSQLKILFKILEKSLATGENVLRRGESTEDETILLRTRLALKKPLRPLEWEFVLESQSAGEMGETILRPCLREASQSADKIETLMSMLEQKDRIITKLLEGIDRSISDLSLLFPSITGSRARKGQTTIEDAQRTVPALKAFSRDLWSDTYPSQGPYSAFESEGLSRLADGCEKCPKHTVAQHEKWVQRLPKATATTSQVARVNALRSSSPVRRDSNVGSESEFETQKLHPSIQQPHPGNATDNETDDETQSEDEPVRSPRHSSPATGSKILPEDEAMNSSPPPLPQPQPQEARQTSDTASSTASETSSDLDAPRPSRAQSSQLQSHSQRYHMKTRRSSSPSPKPQKTRAQLNSSHPSSPPQEQYQPRPGTASSTASSTTSQHTSKPPRLGRLGSSRLSQLATSQKAADTQTSAPPTPSRRFQRLGRNSSQASSRPQSRDTNTKITEASDLEAATPAKADDSDTSTASESSSPPQPNLVTKKLPHVLGQLKSSTSPTLKRDLAPAEDVEEDKEQLTKEDLANRRREELKRKIGTDSAKPSAAVTGAPRKKRKF